MRREGGREERGRGLLDGEGERCREREEGEGREMRGEVAGY